MKTFLQRVIPGFSELEVFVVGYTTLLVIFSYSHEVLDFLRAILEIEKQFQGLQEYVNGYVISYLLLISFIFLSVYHVFSERKKSLFEKGLLFFCMFFVHVAVVIKLALGHLGEPLGNALLIWNFLYVYILGTYVYYGLSEKRRLFTRMIKDESVAYLEIVVTAYTALILFIFMTYVYENGGFLTFALVLVTTVPLSKGITHYVQLVRLIERYTWSKRKVLVLIIVPLLIVYIIGRVF